MKPQKQTKPAKVYGFILKDISYIEVVNKHFGSISTPTLDCLEHIPNNNENVNSQSNTIKFRKSTNASDLELCFPDDSLLQNKDQPVDIIDILGDSEKGGKNALYFFDSKKIKVKIWPIMIDSNNTSNLSSYNSSLYSYPRANESINTLNNVLSNSIINISSASPKNNIEIMPLYTKKPCRFCHHSFDSHPLGCPINYVPHIKNENDPKRIKIANFLKENNLPHDNTEHFETEAILCSWSCMKSYIYMCLSVNYRSHKYKNSLSYMSLLYKKIYGIKGCAPIIPVAHQLEVLAAYTGFLSIKDYRMTFGMLKYEETPNIKRPYMYSSTSYIEEIKV